MNRTLPTPRDERIFRAIAAHTCLTAQHVRRLFFSDGHHVATLQTVNARLRRLVDARYLERQVLDGGRGAGPYVYRLTTSGAALIGISPSRSRGRPGSPRHALIVADFRVVLERDLVTEGGSLEWIGEPELRRVRPQPPIPDGIAFWRLHGRQGVLAVEVDLGTESFAVLQRKLDGYSEWWRTRRYRCFAPMALKPRLALLCPAGRAIRLITITERIRAAGTIAIAPIAVATSSPLRQSWWRSDRSGVTALLLE